MTGHGVDGLLLAAVTDQGAGVEEQAVAGQLGGLGGVEHGEGAGVRLEVARGGVGFGGVEGQAGGGPGGDAAVEDAHLGMAEVAEHPPGAGRGDVVALVVADHRAVGADALGAHRGGEGLGFGQGMAPSAAGRRGQLGVEVDEDGGGDVPLAVGGQAVAGGQPDGPAHVEHGGWAGGAERGVELGGGGERADHDGWERYAPRLPVGGDRRPGGQ